jgi:REP element-mobilizing transposase RayT
VQSTIEVDATSGRVPPKIKRRDVASTLLNAFDPSESIGSLSGNLPHWRQDGTTYFVTLRTADSLPQSKLQQWLKERAEWLGKNSEPLAQSKRYEYWLRFPARFQDWLDQGHGSCVLARQEFRELVQSALEHFAGDRYELRDQVVMPNHVHVIATPWAGHSLSSIVKSWKSFTAHKINSALRRSGPFWQKESFDHIVRNAESLDKFREYIEMNRNCRRALQRRLA